MSHVVICAMTALAILPAAPAAAADRPVSQDRSAGTPWWERRIGDLVAGRAVSVAIGADGAFWYRHEAWIARTPASNEKLLLSMALLGAMGPDRTIDTRAMADSAPIDGVIHGDLWIVGNGDPEVGADRLRTLADAIASSGVSSITGSVLGDMGPFRRDWWAEGWKDDFPVDEVAIPTALTFRGNVAAGGAHIGDPELRASAFLTDALRRRGVTIEGPPGTGRHAPRDVTVASVSSPPIVDIIRRMDVDSINFDAEVLGKLLGAETSHDASIAGAAAAIDAFTSANGAPGFEHHDASGLSYEDRVTARGMLRLLFAVDEQPWASALRFALPIGGQGTLEGRLGHLRVRAKTGTLTDISALSGWVWSGREDGWVAFSILDAGMSKDEAVRIEDAIVRLVSAYASAPGG